MRKPASVATAFNVFRIGKKIGEGGSGVVYAATDDDSKPAAVKLLKPERATEAKRKRFKNEYLFCSRISHPHVVRVTDSGVHDGSPFFVMPLFDGSIRGKTTSIPPHEKLELFLKILAGVEAAHLYGVLHRDLKPENVLCSDDLEQIVVTDFGIARFDDDEVFTAVETQLTERLANFQYRAPEQLERKGNLGHGTDIFALGLMLNEFFTDKVPIGSGYKTIAAVSPEHGYLDAIVQKTIHQDIARRFSSIDELKRELIKQSELQISRQKLDELNQTVVQVEHPSDPLIADPIKIVGVDWNDQRLSATLNQNATGAWIEAFRGMGGYSYTSVLNPARVEFQGNAATIHCDARSAQSAVDFLKGWLTVANKTYEANVRKHIAKTERELQERLKREKEAEEQRQHILSTLTF